LNSTVAGLLAGIVHADDDALAGLGYGNAGLLFLPLNLASFFRLKKDIFDSTDVDSILTQAVCVLEPFYELLNLFGFYLKRN